MDKDLVVLGCSWGRKGGGVGPVLKERLDHALTLFRKGNYSRLIFSGGKKQAGVSEAKAMLLYIRDVDPYIRPNQMMLEEKSYDSVSQAYELKVEFGHNWTFDLVTSKTHARRVSWIFKSWFGDTFVVLTTEKDSSGLYGQFWEIPGWIVSISKLLLYSYAGYR